jgi:hypothetical protein
MKFWEQPGHRHHLAARPSAASVRSNSLLFLPAFQSPSPLSLIGVRRAPKKGARHPSPCAPRLANKQNVLLRDRPWIALNPRY